MAVAVLVVLAVGLVVALVVADQVLQRETVVRADVVDRRVGLPARRLEDLPRSGHDPRQRRQLVWVAAPETARDIAELVVPFAPARRKAADLVAAGTEVPGLGNELHLAQDRVLPDGSEETRTVREVEWIAGERGGEIEAEAINVVVLDP